MGIQRSSPYTSWSCESYPSDSKGPDILPLFSKVYCANIQGGEHARFLRQVNEFPIATNHESVYTRMCDDPDAELRVAMK